MNLFNTLRRQPEGITDGAVAIAKLCEDPCAEQLIRTGGYCKLLLGQVEQGWEDDALSAASEVLQSEMAYIPAGSTRIHSIATPGDMSQPTTEVSEAAFFIDRYAVTNAQFERFVNAEGYRLPELWPEEIFPLLFQFVDQTNHPGPQRWRNGTPPSELREHPVVGINWYEANAYATWIGKNLPTSTQWQRAGTWWKPNVRHPWGNSFAPQRANTGSQPIRSTVPVNNFAEGATPNGVYQLVGNVWEWTFASFEEIEVEGKLCSLDEPLAEIRGAAYDTYLASQCNCIFRSGQPMLCRAENVGFRCCIAADGLKLGIDDE